MTRPMRTVLIAAASLAILFVVINPLAGVGFALLFLLVAFPFVVYRWARQVLGRRHSATQAVGPGSILTVRGTMTPAQLAAFEARFRAGMATGRTTALHEHMPYAPVESPLPECFRHPAWASALVDHEAGGQVPRDHVPLLDRDFATVTDCRFHHMAAHQIHEVRDGFIVRECTVCSPSTFWIERA